MVTKLSNILPQNVFIQQQQSTNSRSTSSPTGGGGGGKASDLMANRLQNIIRSQAATLGLIRLVMASQIVITTPCYHDNILTTNHPSGLEVVVLVVEVEVAVVRLIQPVI